MAGKKGKRAGNLSVRHKKLAGTTEARRYNKHRLALGDEMPC